MSFYPDTVEGLVESAGTPIRFYDNGATASPADGHTIALLHGTGGSTERSFSSLYPMLAFKHRVIAVDFTDHADHADQDSPLTLDTLSTQALSVLRHAVPGGRVTLVGYSLGAVVAAQVAAHHPDVVKNLVLVAGWAKSDAHQRLRYDLWQELYDSQHPSLAAFMVYSAYSPAFLNSRTPEELRRMIDALRAAPDRSRAIALNRTIDISGALPDIRARTLIVGCTYDQMVPLRHSQLLFGGIADSTLVEIPAGHAVVHERPAQLFREIHDFVVSPSAFAAGTVKANHHA